MLDGAKLGVGSGRTSTVTDHGEGKENKKGGEMVDQGEHHSALAPPPSPSLQHTITAFTAHGEHQQHRDNNAGGKEGKVGSSTYAREHKCCVAAASPATTEWLGATPDDDHQQHESQSQSRRHSCSAGGVEKWVTVEVDPFLHAMREAMVRERPADILGFVSELAARWRI